MKLLSKLKVYTVQQACMQSLSAKEIFQMLFPEEAKNAEEEEKREEKDDGNAEDDQEEAAEEEKGEGEEPENEKTFIEKADLLFMCTKEKQDAFEKMLEERNEQLSYRLFLAKNYAIERPVTGWEVFRKADNN